MARPVLAARTSRPKRRLVRPQSPLLAAGKRLGAWRIRHGRTSIAAHERAGVPEVWLVHPTDRIVTVYRTVESPYGRPRVHHLEGLLTVDMLPEVVIDEPRFRSGEEASRPGNHYRAGWTEANLGGASTERPDPYSD
ncbi:MAG: Uma2 family endonuclease [Betaproteobacteria bacterium]|nr:Uma2 family endonuclease [Betaproteobacteria bacterium]